MKYSWLLSGDGTEPLKTTLQKVEEAIEALDSDVWFGRKSAHNPGVSQPSYAPLFRGGGRPATSLPPTGRSPLSPPLARNISRSHSAASSMSSAPSTPLECHAAAKMAANIAKVTCIPILSSPSKAPLNSVDLGSKNAEMTSNAHATPEDGRSGSSSESMRSDYTQMPAVIVSDSKRPQSRTRLLGVRRLFIPSSCLPGVRPSKESLSSSSTRVESEPTLAVPQNYLPDCVPSSGSGVEGNPNLTFHGNDEQVCATRREEVLDAVETSLSARNNSSSQSPTAVCTQRVLSKTLNVVSHCDVATSQKDELPSPCNPSTSGVIPESPSISLGLPALIPFSAKSDQKLGHTLPVHGAPEAATSLSEISSPGFRPTTHSALCPELKSAQSLKVSTGTSSSTPRDGKTDVAAPSLAPPAASAPLPALPPSHSPKLESPTQNATPCTAESRPLLPAEIPEAATAPPGKAVSIGAFLAAPMKSMAGSPAAKMDCGPAISQPPLAQRAENDHPKPSQLADAHHPLTSLPGKDSRNDSESPTPPQIPEGVGTAATDRVPSKWRVDVWPVSASKRLCAFERLAAIENLCS